MEHIEMIQRLLSALEHHTEQTRPVHSTELAIEAAREHLRQAAKQPKACFIGARGSAFDSPETKRAYTYKEQPGNAIAYSLGFACDAAARQSAGDSIDRGLCLLQQLDAIGFGVFDLGAQYTISAQLLDAAQALIDQQNAEPARQSIEFLMRGEKMAFKIGAQQFTLDYEPSEPGEFDFMRNMLTSAISSITPDVKPAQQPLTSWQRRQVIMSVKTVGEAIDMVEAIHNITRPTIPAPQLEAAQALIDQQAAQALGKEGGAA